MGQGRGTAAIWVVAAILATLAAVRVLDDGGGAGEPAPVRVEGSVGDAGGGAGERRLYVHVAGAVRRPGLYRLPPSERVAAAIERAGGATRRADLGVVNLAARLQDGQQVVVPKAGGAGLGAGAIAADGTGAKIPLGSATVEDLEEIDGIGPTLAARIVERRDAEGGFASIDELGEVEGIGEQRLESLREAVQP